MNAIHRPALPGLQPAISAFLALVFWMGCGSTTRITNTQSVSVTGPLFQPAVRLNRTTEEPGIRLSPWLRYSGQRDRLGNVGEHSPVNAAGQYQVDTVVKYGQTYLYESPANINQFHGNNYGWRLPAISGGVNFDLDAFDNLSLLMGLGLTSVQRDPYLSAHAGFGFNFSGEDVGGRFEVLLTWETVSSVVQAVERIHYSSTDQTEVRFFNSGSKSLQSGYYLALTLQGSGRNTVFYTQFAFGVQSILSSSDFDDILLPHRLDYIHSVSFVSITPGLALPVAENLRLITGVRVMSDQRTGGLTSSLNITPLVQLEISF